MNLALFNKLWEGPPSQHRLEWLMFLKMCELYLKEHKIEKPIVVELGVLSNRQKKFYEQLLGAEHIGIDMSVRKGTPDIHGDTHDVETFNKLKKRLNGRAINVLFIDTFHHYEFVKQDFEMYAPLCTDIIAFHDIEYGRHQNNRRKMVWKFWDELKERAFTKGDELANYMFFSLWQAYDKRIDTHRRLGIGMIIKK